MRADPAPQGEGREHDAAPPWAHPCAHEIVAELHADLAAGRLADAAAHDLIERVWARAQPADLHVSCPLECPARSR